MNPIQFRQLLALFFTVELKRAVVEDGLQRKITFFHELIQRQLAAFREKGTDVVKKLYLDDTARGVSEGLDLSTWHCPQRVIDSPV